MTTEAQSIINQVNSIANSPDFLEINKAIDEKTNHIKTSFG